MKYENKFNKAKSEYGVGEWADWSYNIGIGCKNNCLYCYAKADAVKYNNIANRECWVNEKVNPYKVDIHIKTDGRVMFPSTHDITPYYLPTYIKTLDNLLKAGNNVLIVSKPHLECVQELCGTFLERKHVEGAVKVFAITKDQCEQAWKWMRRHIGFEKDKEFVIHSLRHSCASRLVNAGIDLYVVKEWLGHSSIQVTERYAHLSPAKLAQAVDILDVNGFSPVAIIDADIDADTKKEIYNLP
jgi:Phage integrase family